MIAAVRYIPPSKVEGFWRGRERKGGDARRLAIVDPNSFRMSNIKKDLGRFELPAPTDAVLLCL